MLVRAGGPKQAASPAFTRHYINALAKKGLRRYIKPMPTYKTVYKCRECGATSYQPVIERAANGALKPTGQYKCTGCRNVFANLRAWWEPRRQVDFQPSQIAALEISPQ